ncbi:MAG: hypothetical protein ABIH46_08415, partial [Chloroflexota bacterium]
MANTLAYGFVGTEHLSAERVSSVGIETVYAMVAESLVEYSRQVNGLMASMVERTTTAKERRAQPGTGTLQPLDEWGNPLPVREAGYYDVAYPVQGAGTAWGTNRISRALMTVEEANRQTIEMLRRDADWMRRHIMAALFDNVAWTYNDRVGSGGADGLGNITVEALANTDTVTYLRTGGAMAVDEHYMAQANAIDDNNNPFDDIYTELMEHPVNGGGPVVVYVATNLTSSISALTNFTDVGDPDLRYGVGVDQIATPFDRGLGDEVLGKCDKCWIVEWKGLPDSYAIAHAQGGGPVLKMREYDSPSIQGF